MIGKPKRETVSKEVAIQEDPLDNLDQIQKSDSEDSEFVPNQRNNIANWDDEENSLKVKSNQTASVNNASND